MTRPAPRRLRPAALAPRFGEASRLALLLALAAVALNLSGWLSRLDMAVFDAAQRLLPPAAPRDVVIVAIDPESLDALGRWPWPRDTDAALLQAICRQQPAAVGLDVAFNEPGADPSADARLAQAIAACGKVVLPVVIETRRSGGPPQEALPIAPLTQAAAALGRVGVEPGSDGIVRSVLLWEGVGDPVWPLFALALLQVAHQPMPGATPQPAMQARPEQPYALVGRDPRLLRYLGPAGTVPRLSAAAVLLGRVSADALRGRIVLVGATATGLGDQFAVPFDRPMAGVELQANVLQGLRHDTLVRPLPQPLALLIVALLAALPLLWLPRLMPLTGLLASLGWLVLLTLAAGAQALWPGVWIPPGGALAAALLAYPLWSWRRLEAARRHLDWELQTLGGNAEPPPQRGAGLSFEQRLGAVQAAQARLQELQSRRDEALAFISHDLRGPLAAAVQRLQDGAPDPRERERLLRQMQRALRLTQTFVALSRAQALLPESLHDVDLSGLLDQAADALLDEAERAGVRLQRELPARPVWVRGDFEAIERMADNLLRNALAHAPAESVVTVALQFDADWAEFSVRDHGPGLSPELRERLFGPYVRGGTPGQRPRAGSTGLGLYFVRVAASKLGGSAGADAGLSEGARFWVRLPRLPDDSVQPRDSQL